MIKHFPEGKIPRENQKEALGLIEESLKLPKKFTVVRAPTGSGKSAIVATLVNFFSSTLNSSSYTVLSRKFLQTQYIEDFDSFTNFWGKSNYTCPIINASCSGCPADQLPGDGYRGFLKINCTGSKLGDKCPYISAKREASVKSNSLMNLEAFLSNPWGNRDIMIFDEAHILSDRMVSYYSLDLMLEILTMKKASELFKKAEGSRLSSSSEVISEILSIYTERLLELEEDGLTVPPELNRSLDLLKNPNLEWVIDTSNYSLVPVKPSKLLRDFLFSYANKVVLLSGTLSPNLLMEMGITNRNCTFIDMQSTFPSENHSIKYFPSMGSLNMKNLEKGLVKACVLIMDILSKQSGRGVIHSTSYKIVKHLRMWFEGPDVTEEGKKLSSRLLFHDSAKDLEKLLTEYKNTEGAVLVSPSLTEGFDGAGKLLEFQVLVKAPYPSLGDPRMAQYTKSEFGNILFQERAICTIIQTLGRGIRSPEDVCTSYVLDSNIAKLLRKGNTDSRFKKAVPNYMMEVWSNRDIVLDQES